MSIFYCAECDNLRDADDGCEETADGLNLICVECVAEAEEADDRRRDNPLEPDYRRLGQ